MPPLGGTAKLPWAGESSSTVWIPARGLGELGIAMLLLTILFPAAMIGLLLWMGILAVFASSVVDLMVAYIGILALLPLTVFFVFTQPRAVGLARDSVTFRFVGRTVVVPWTSISPDLLHYWKGGLRVRFLLPGRRAPGWPSTLTPEQGRALLTTPHAPRWVGPREVLRQWGLQEPQP